MITASRIKRLAAKAGADLCGVAPVSRFSQAPPGFAPADIWAGARSVVVVARRLPEGAMRAPGPVPYTWANEATLTEVFRLTRDMAILLEDKGVGAVPVPSEPYEYWDEEKREGRGILSLKHAAVLAGLGVMGTNTLLTNDRFGNRITLGALLVDRDLDGDAARRIQAGVRRLPRLRDGVPGGRGRGRRRHPEIMPVEVFDYHKEGVFALHLPHVQGGVPERPGPLLTGRRTAVFLKKKEG